MNQKKIQLKFADMELDMVADIKVDMVSDMAVDILADIDIDINIEIQIGERVRHGVGVGSKLFRPEAYPPGLHIF